MENNNGSFIFKNILAEDLVKDLGSPNQAGFFTKSSPTLKDDILKRITPQNASEIFKYYKAETGVDLITAIKKNTAINTKTKEQLVLHLEERYAGSASHKESGRFVGELLFDDINGLGSGNLKEHLKLIYRNNLKYVLKTYADKSLKKYHDTHATISEIASYLPFDVSYENENKLIDKIAPYEGLMSAIDGETGLSKKERKEMISQIISVSVEDLPDEVKAEIKKDIDEHPQDYNKIHVDVLRALNKTAGDFRNPNEEGVIIEPNGQFDGTIKQGRTGDCWLLAAVDSIIAKPEGKKAIESLIKYDKQTGDATITLKGEKKQYKISAQEINAAINYATGDGDARIIEIAMDKYIKEECYSSNYPNVSIDEEFDFISLVDINGNWPRELYFTLFGTDNYDFNSDEIDPAKEDFSNPQKAYSFALKGDSPMELFAKNSKNKDVSIERRHAYAIVGSDDKNVYIVNPWDSSDTLTMTREDFKKLNIRIDSCNIPKV